MEGKGEAGLKVSPSRLKTEKLFCSYSVFPIRTTKGKCLLGSSTTHPQAIPGLMDSGVEHPEIRQDDCVSSLEFHLSRQKEGPCFGSRHRQLLGLQQNAFRSADRCAIRGNRYTVIDTEKHTFSYITDPPSSSL